MLFKYQSLVLPVDHAATLGLFAVAGSTRAINAHLRRLPALLLGIVTAVGGGSTLIAILTAFGLRILSLRYNWQTRAVRHDA